MFISLRFVNQLDLFYDLVRFFIGFCVTALVESI